MKEMKLTLTELEDILSKPLRRDEDGWKIAIPIGKQEYLEKINEIITRYSNQKSPFPDKSIRAVRIYRTKIGKTITEYGWTYEGIQKYLRDRNRWGITHLIEIVPEETTPIVEENLIEMMLM